jgi:hypothetical protein
MEVVLLSEHCLILDAVVFTQFTYYIQFDVSN